MVNISQWADSLVNEDNVKITIPLIPDSDNTSSDPASGWIVDNKGASQVFSMDFWSNLQNLVTITAGAQDLALPSVTVAGIPAGATLKRVIAILKYRVAEDTSASDNKISTAGPVTPAVQVKESVAGVFTDAITIVDDAIQVAASTRDGGDVIVGGIDVKAEVDADDTYDFQLDDILADGANLLLRDLQVGLRVVWTV